MSMHEVDYFKNVRFCPFTLRRPLKCLTGSVLVKKKILKYVCSAKWKRKVKNMKVFRNERYLCMQSFKLLQSDK